MRELCRDYPTATIVLAGDFNQLTDSAVIEQTGLVQLVQQPTRELHGDGDDGINPRESRGDGS